MHQHNAATLAFLLYVALGAGLLALIVYRLWSTIGPIFPD